MVPKSTTRHCAWLAVGLLLLAGCSEDSRRCRSERDRAQELVKSLDSKSTDSLSAAVAALASAIDACEKAAMGAEREKLVEAKNQIGAHLALLEKRAKRRKPPTAEELARLVEQGDPTCPKSQKYLQAKQEIRCTGPELVDMTLEQAREYFGSRNYKLTVGSGPPTLRAEQGAELYVFTWDTAGGATFPKCLELYPIPNVPLVEAVGRATGARLEKIKHGGSIQAARGELAVKLEESEKKLVAKLGDCGG
jgi:outer membrane murein-binding lipoprotein Lpp